MSPPRIAPTRRALLAGLSLAALARAEPLRRGWSGAEVTAIEEGKPGIKIKRVTRTSPAELAGLKRGDVVLKVADKVVPTPVDFHLAIRENKAGDTVELSLVRAGKAVTARVSLVAFPGVEAVLRLDKLGTFAPGLPGLKDLRGHVPSSMGELRGKVVVLDFWASFCAPCKATVPVLNGWSSRLGAQGLVALGVSPDRYALASKAAGDFGIGYAAAADEEGKVVDDYGVSAYPTLFVIDKQGVIRELEVGYAPSAMKRFEALFEKLLAEKVE